MIDKSKIQDEDNMVEGKIMEIYESSPLTEEELKEWESEPTPEELEEIMKSKEFKKIIKK